MFSVLGKLFAARLALTHAVIATRPNVATVLEEDPKWLDGLNS
jgi:hypothetical protein